MDSIYNLPHHEGNPRNSEGSFVRLKDGRILFVYTRYQGNSWDDHATADLAAKFSTDNGRTWSAEDTIMVQNDSLNVMSVSLLRLQDGRIALLHLRKSAFEGGGVDCRPWVRFSSDEGQTWSSPIDITKLPPSYQVVNNDRLIQLKNGRLALPIAFHRFRNPNGEKFDVDFRGIVAYYLSDDGGQNWRESREVVLPLSHKITTGYQEPGVVELSDGRLFSWYRTSDGAQHGSYSEDFGDTWSQPFRAHQFPSMHSPLSMKAHPETHELFAVWADLDPRWHVTPQEGSWSRTPLVMARSTDNGQSWHDHRMLESEPDHGYCYIAMHFTDDNALLLAYCCGGGKDGAVLQDLRIRRIEL